MPIIDVVTTQYAPIKNGPALHGADIGQIGPDQKIKVDTDALHDGWVPITGPEPFGPTWLGKEEQGWIKTSWYRPVEAHVSRAVITYDKDHDTFSIEPM
jgi:hypothetical protein